MMELCINQRETSRPTKPRNDIGRIDHPNDMEKWAKFLTYGRRNMASTKHTEITKAGVHLSKEHHGSKNSRRAYGVGRVRPFKLIHEPWSLYWYHTTHVQAGILGEAVPIFCRREGGSIFSAREGDKYFLQGGGRRGKIFK